MPPTPLAPDLILRARRIHVLGDQPPAEALLLRAGRVAFAGNYDEARGLAAPGARVEDLRDAVVTPGLTDAHVHLTEHLSRGLMLDDIPVTRYLPDWLLPLYATVTPEEEAAAAQLACVEMIRTGTTTFCEAGTLFDVSAVAEAVEQVGMRAVLGRWTWDLEGQAGRMRQTTDDALALTEEMLGKVNGRGEGRIGAWPLLLGFGTCSDALIRGAHALAERHGAGWGMMQSALHPSRPSRDTIPLAHLDGLGVLGPRASRSRTAATPSSHPIPSRYSACVGGAECMSE